LYEDDPVIEFDVRTDEISVKDGYGKDVTINFFTPDVDNNGKFYTDSNGLEMQKRKLKSVNLTNTEDISSSFYPVTSAIVIRDDDNSMEDGNRDQLTILTSRI
jgi:lysosomal alpha-mannosidase